MSNLTPTEIAEINEFVEAEAYVSYYHYAPLEFARPFRLEVRRIGPAWVTMIPGMDNANHNLILGMGISEPATEPGLDEAIALFKKAGCQNYRAKPSPLCQPSQYPQWLAARGFKPGRNWAKMYRGNEPIPAISTDLRLEMIGKELADDFADVVLPTFDMPPFLRSLVKGMVGMPGWRHYLAFEREKPVSAAAMFIYGEAAWLGWAGTLKTHRKRGAHNALLARRIEDGMALGCKAFVAETEEDTPEIPNPSFQNMLRSGFKLAYLRRNFTHRSPADPGKKVRRALMIAAYGLRFEWQSLWRWRKTG